MKHQIQTAHATNARIHWESLETFLIVAACSILFCSKGVFIKSAYGLGADPILHYLVQGAAGGHEPIVAGVHLHAITLAIFGTVAPSFLLGIGLRRAGAQRFAIISTVGPLATILLAWVILGEALNAIQVAGFLLAMTGGVLVSLWK